MNEMRRLMEMADYSPEGDIIASVGEFTVVREHEMVHVLDGEQNVRLSMFANEWRELTNSGADDLHDACEKAHSEGFSLGFEEGYAQARDEYDQSEFD